MICLRCFGNFSVPFKLVVHISVNYCSVGVVDLLCCFIKEQPAHEAKPLCYTTVNVNSLGWNKWLESIKVLELSVCFLKIRHGILFHHVHGDQHTLLKYFSKSITFSERIMAALLSQCDLISTARSLSTCCFTSERIFQLLHITIEYCA